MGLESRGSREKAFPLSEVKYSLDAENPTGPHFVRIFTNITKVDGTEGSCRNDSWVHQEEKEECQDVNAYGHGLGLNPAP